MDCSGNNSISNVEIHVESNGTTGKTSDSSGIVIDPSVIDGESSGIAGGSPGMASGSSEMADDEDKRTETTESTVLPPPVQPPFTAQPLSGMANLTFPLDYIVRFHITADGQLDVKCFNRYEGNSSLDNYDDSCSASDDEDDDGNNGKRIKTTPKEESSQTLVEILNDDDNDEYMILKILNRLSKRNKVIRLDTRSTEDNSTALHIAARKGFTKLVEWLLEKHASPYTRNKLRQTPLEVAIQEKHDETAEVLVKKMRKESVIRLFWNKERATGAKRPKQGRPKITEDNKEIKLSIKSLLIDDMQIVGFLMQRLDLLIQKTTLAVLDHFSDDYHSIYLVGPLEMDDANRIPTDENYNTKDMTAYQLISRKDLRYFSCHECVKSLTASKWRAYGNGLLWRTALVFFIFLGLLSFAAVTGVTADDVTKCNQTIDYFRVIAEILVCIYALLTFVGEIIQIVNHKTDYLKDIFNYMELGSSVLILCVIPLRFTYQSAQWHVFAFGYILWAFRIFKIATMNQFIGHLGHIILHLFMYDVWKFVVYFLIILLSFSGGLLLSLKGDDDLAVHSETSDFGGILFFGVRVLIEGQPFLDYTGPNGYSTVSCIVVLAFLTFTCVVMLNIFIAMLSNRFDDIQQNEKSYFHNNVAKTMAKLELKDDLTIFRFGEPLWKKFYKDEINMADIKKEKWTSTTLTGFRSGIGVNLCRGKCPGSKVSAT